MRQQRRRLLRVLVPPSLSSPLPTEAAPPAARWLSAALAPRVLPSWLQASPLPPPPAPSPACCRPVAPARPCCRPAAVSPPLVQCGTSRPAGSSWLVPELEAAPDGGSWIGRMRGSSWREQKKRGAGTCEEEIRIKRKMNLSFMYL